MRIVSGKKKGLSLKAVSGMNTRPTTDKVKESIFNIVGPYFDGGIGLDLFGGSGNLGIEGLSRGLDSVVFVDKDMKALQTIRENLKRCDLEAQAEVYRNDAMRALKALIKREIAFDIIFLDPPYKDDVISSILAIVGEYKLIKDGGIIVAEHHKDIRLPENIGMFKEIKYENYGICSIQVFQACYEEGEM